MGALRRGVRLGPYEVAAAIDTGGMGEVYRATDTRLHRTVAIKALPEPIARDTAELRRLDREAEVISRLNHPHICRLYDVVEHLGSHFLVMEYLDGETLADRLLRGPVPADECLDIAVQIAEAVHHAHTHGVVHGDLKPANIMLTESGVKLLDFGIATSTATLAPDLRLAETVRIGSPLSVTGSLPYLAPEQLRGGNADVRTDIYSFGVVIYEAVAGRPPYRADSQAGLIAAVLSETPARLTVGNPALHDIDHVVRKCLAKEPAQRWQSAGDVADELRWMRECRVLPVVPLAAGTRPRAHRWLGGGVAAALSLAAVAGVMNRPTATVSVPRPVQFVIDLDRGMTWSALLDPMALSPDGRFLAFVAAARGGPNVLWIRSFDSLQARPVEQTEGAQGPFWSPDSRDVAFFADGFLKVVSVGRDVPRIVCRTPAGYSGAWSPEGVIVFAPGANSGLVRVAASGGLPEPLTILDTEHQDTGHNWPQFLPDGRSFIYLVRSPDVERAGVYAGRLDERGGRLLFHSDSQAVYAPPDHLFSTREGKIVVRRFDPVTPRVIGGPLPLDLQIANNRMNAFHGRSALTVTDDKLVYRAAALSELVWFDRDGREFGRVGTRGAYENVDISPNDQLAAVGQFASSGVATVSVVTLAGGVWQDVTTPTSPGARPIWSPDAERLVLVAHRKSRSRLYESSSGNTATERVRLDLPFTPALGPTDWPTPMLALFERSGEGTRKDIWALPLDGSQEPFPVVQTTGDDMGARLSPDGHWVAYTSNDSGTYQVFLQPFPSGNRLRVSPDGGIEPKWSRHGRELLYIDPSGVLMSVTVPPAPSRTLGRPRRLFTTPLRGTLEFASGGNQYDVTADGSRLLLAVPLDGVTRLHAMMHWRSGLKADPAEDTKSLPGTTFSRLLTPP